MWLPVDPVSKHTCLRLVKGSHRLPHYFKPVPFDGLPFTSFEVKPGDEEKAKQLLPAPDIDGNEQFEVLSWDMKVITISYHKSPCTLVGKSQGTLPGTPRLFSFFFLLLFLYMMKSVFVE